MTRRELLTWCVSGVLTGGFVSARTAFGQEQPDACVSAISPARNSSSSRRASSAEPGTVELQMPRELEQLLLAWERESAKIKKLKGKFHRFVYDGVYFVENRAAGEFWYESPDQGRMDFGISQLRPVSIKKGPNGEPYTVQQDPLQRWICTGKEIYIIHDSQKLFDRIEIPPQQQGRNIMNGPLPFLFGMKADQAKEVPPQLGSAALAAGARRREGWRARAVAAADSCRRRPQTGRRRAGMEPRGSAPEHQVPAHGDPAARSDRQ